MNELKRARYDAGLSMQDLHEKSGVAKSTLIDVESGRRFPRAETAKAIADALGVKPSDLFFDEPEPSSTPLPEAA